MLGTLMKRFLGLLGILLALPPSSLIATDPGVKTAPTGRVAPTQKSARTDFNVGHFSLGPALNGGTSLGVVFKLGL